MSEWIKCSDRLPEVGTPVLAYITYPKGTLFNALARPLKRCDVHVAGLNHQNEFIYYLDQFGPPMKFVTHWMPIPPEPPKD